ncbi:DUF1499 domain-containing protein [Paenibacillus thermoaerophilus]|uniref:DUF1499 domain-containing protein n=1 Tax=Paenibacillus thermoaerophilus TaxID=1215385 RepID=A0ABW2V998_9BACL|nr:DUF1499 domain-containing protein [Paenibacillus thermoaerophilus]TMV17846.1 DUF1499 domain-containing protein [Paenibacillus thermoaerophilus]
MLKRTLIGLVRSHETTGEKARIPELKTRHYKIPKEQLWEEVQSVLKKLPGYKLLHAVENVGEIVAEKKTVTGRVQDITLTLFSLGPMRSAVDIYSASRGSLGDLGSNYRVILQIYNELDRRLAQHKITNN